MFADESLGCGYPSIYAYHSVADNVILAYSGLVRETRLARNSNGANYSPARDLNLPASVSGANTISEAL